MKTAAAVHLISMEVINFVCFIPLKLPHRWNQVHLVLNDQRVRDTQAHWNPMPLEILIKPNNFFVTTPPNYPRKQSVAIHLSYRRYYCQKCVRRAVAHDEPASTATPFYAHGPTIPSCTTEDLSPKMIKRRSLGALTATSRLSAQSIRGKVADGDTDGDDTST